MYTVRELLAVVLAAAIGLALVARPNLVMRFQAFTAGPTTGHRGSFGGEPEFEDRTIWLARGFGALALLVAGYILVQPLL